MFVLRILGVPSAIDFIPISQIETVVTIGLPLSIPESTPPRYIRWESIKHPKFTDGPIHIIRQLNRGKREYVPYFFLDPFNKDVTDLYIPTSEIRLSAQGIRNIRHGYLAIFNDLSWQPIACSKPAGQEIIFPKMGKDIVYLPVHYTNKKEMVPFAPPLILYSDGTVHPIIANKDSLQYMKLVRKYPNRGEKATIGTPLLSIHISKPPTIRISNPLIPSARSATSPIIAINLFRSIPLLSYRYWRFVANEAWRAHLSDLRFYDKHKQEIKRKNHRNGFD